MNFYVKIKHRSLIKIKTKIVPLNTCARTCLCICVCSCKYKLLQRPSNILDFFVAFYAMPSLLCSFLCIEIHKSDDVSVDVRQADVCPGR